MAEKEIQGTKHAFAKQRMSVHQWCWKQHNGLLPFSLVIVATRCRWEISCFMSGTCWAETGADIEPSSSCAWIDTNPAFSCLSPVPDVKSSLLMVHNFLRDVRWHDKLKHSKKCLGAASFYFYIELTRRLSELAVVSGWQFNIAPVIFFGCCLQHFAFSRWSRTHYLFRQSNQPLGGHWSFLCSPFPFESLLHWDASNSFTQEPQAQIGWDFISDISGKHILVFKDLCYWMLCSKHRNKNHRDQNKKSSLQWIFLLAMNVKREPAWHYPIESLFHQASSIPATSIYYCRMLRKEISSGQAPMISCITPCPCCQAAPGSVRDGCRSMAEGLHGSVARLY